MLFIDMLPFSWIKALVAFRDLLVAGMTPSLNSGENPNFSLITHNKRSHYTMIEDSHTLKTYQSSSSTW